MPIPFSRSLRAMRGHSLGRELAFYLIFSLNGAAWIAWLLFAKVSLYEVSRSARVEAQQRAHEVDAPFDSTIQQIHLALGQRVKAGEALVKLEATPEELQLQEQTARANSKPTLLKSLKGEIAVSQEAVAFSKAARAASLQEAEAHLREAEAAAALSEAKAQKYEHLQADGIISQLDAMQQTAEARRNRAFEESLRKTLERIREESSREITDREARLAELQKQAAELRATQTIDEAEETRLRQEVARRTILAPDDGVIGEVTELRRGSFAAAGTRLATIIPDGHLQVSGEFDTQTALGRIRPGQLARLRLFSFPWAEYGQIPLRVSRVSDEPRDGAIRVECELSNDIPSLINVQHGLTGILEVETGKVSPAALILREAGYRLRFGGAAENGN